MSKIPKLANQILVGFLMLIFFLVSCNDKKKDSKMDTMVDTATTKPVKTPD